MTIFKIGKRIVGSNYPPLIISEIGINHNGSVDLAIHLAGSAIKAGAEVIKHQTHVVDDEMSEEAKKVIPGNAKISIYKTLKLYISHLSAFFIISHIISVFDTLIYFLTLSMHKLLYDSLN